MLQAQSSAIASTSKETQPQLTKPLKPSAEQQRKDSPAAVRVISVPKSQIVLVNRSKRRINDPVDSNGVNLPSRPAVQKKVSDVPPVKNSATYSLQAVRSTSGTSKPAPSPGGIAPKPVSSAAAKAPKNGQATRTTVGQSIGQGKVAQRFLCTQWCDSGLVLVTQLIFWPMV